MRGTDREEVMGPNSPRSGQGADSFTLREIVNECEEGDYCGFCCVFPSSKDVLNVQK